MNEKIEDVYKKYVKEENIKSNYLILEVVGDIGDIPVVMPKVKYIFKNH